MVVEEDDLEETLSGVNIEIHYVPNISITMESSNITPTRPQGTIKRHYSAWTLMTIKARFKLHPPLSIIKWSESKSQAKQ